MFLKQRFGRSFFWARIAHNIDKSNVLTLHFPSGLLGVGLCYLPWCNMAPPHSLGTPTPCPSQKLRLAKPMLGRDELFSATLAKLDCVILAWPRADLWTSQLCLNPSLSLYFPVMCISEFYSVVASLTFDFHNFVTLNKEGHRAKLKWSETEVFGLFVCLFVSPRIAEELQFGNACCSKLLASPLRVWDRLYLWTRSTKRRKSSQSLSSKLTGLRMERESWWVFIGQEASLGLL